MGLFGTSTKDIARMASARNLPGLVKALGYTKDSSVQCAAAEALGQLRDSAAVAALQTLLDGSRSDVIVAAIGALGLIKDPRATPALVKLVVKSGVRPEIVTAAVTSLGQLSTPDAADALVDALRAHARYPPLVEAAIRNALVVVGSPAVSKLVSLIAESDVTARGHACAVLRALNWRPASAVEKVYFYLHTQQGDLLDLNDGELLPVLAKVAQDKESFIRERAATALGKSRSRVAVEALEGLLKDRDQRVILAAVRALAPLDSPTSVSSLLMLLEGRDEAIAEEAIRGLQQRGEAATTEMIRRLRSIALGGYHNLRCLAVRTLVDLAITDVIPDFVALLNDDPPDLREELPRAFARFGEPSVSSLLTAWQDKSRQYRFSPALKAVGVPAIRPLHDIVMNQRSEHRRAAARLLMEMDWKPRGSEGLYPALVLEKLDKAVETGRTYLDELIGALQDSMLTVRATGISALARIGGVKAVTSLIPLIGADDPEIGRRAIEALGEIRSDEAVRPIINSLGHPRLRIAAAYALGKIKAREAVPPLLQLLVSNDRYAKDAAAVALGDIGDPQAADRLFAAIEDPEFDVSTTVALSLAKLGDRRALDPLRKIYEDKRASAHRFYVREAIKKLDAGSL